MSRRLSLPQTPLSTPILGPFPSGVPLGSPLLQFERRQLPLRPNKSLTCLHKVPLTSPRVRLSHPDLHATIVERFPVELQNRPRLLPTPKPNIPKRFLKRSNHSDLAYRLQKHNDPNPHSNESTPVRDTGE
ncbi:hypothetical protein Q1695_006631 [Nippostrongylus brasiliensis]|nr:hypothetical protein Q1695_006631 [Nippostrongylus brasiliensis]